MRRAHWGGPSLAKRKVFALLISVAAVLVSATVLVAVWHVSSSTSSAPTPSLSTDADDVWFFDTARASSSLSARAMDETSLRGSGRAVDSVQPAVKFKQLGLTAPKWFMKIPGKSTELNNPGDKSGKAFDEGTL